MRGAEDGRGDAADRDAGDGAPDGGDARAADADADAGESGGGDASAGDRAPLVDRLLGNHGTTSLEESLLDHEHLERIATSVLAGAIPGRSLLGGFGRRGRGVDDVEEHVARGHARETLVRALVAAIRRAAESGGERPQRRVDERTFLSPLPDRDRRAAARTRLARHFGAPAPRLFARPMAAEGHERVRVAVYLDVSGSMHDVLPALRDALLRVRRDVDVRLWQWSERVHRAPDRWWTAGAIRTTGGTAIECVLAHAVTQAPRTRRLLVVTDGWYGSATRETIGRLRSAGVTVHMALTPNAGSAPRDAWIDSLTRLG